MQVTKTGTLSNFLPLISFYVFSEITNCFPRNSHYFDSSVILFRMSRSALESGAAPSFSSPILTK